MQSSFIILFNIIYLLDDVQDTTIYICNNNKLNQFIERKEKNAKCLKTFLANSCLIWHKSIATESELPSAVTSVDLRLGKHSTPPHYFHTTTSNFVNLV